MQHRNLHSIATEMFEIKHDIFPEMVLELFIQIRESQDKPRFFTADNKNILPRNRKYFILRT